MRQCGHRIMAITSAFQADDAGSIPAARSTSKEQNFDTRRTVCTVVSFLPSFTVLALRDEHV